jgi:hypothetical protein
MFFWDLTLSTKMAVQSTFCGFIIKIELFHFFLLVVAAACDDSKKEFLHDRRQKSVCVGFREKEEKFTLKLSFYALLAPRCAIKIGESVIN